MGRDLNCIFHLKSGEKQTYWWPLLFEAMHWQSFHFTAPDKPDGTGVYYYRRISDAIDADLVVGSFQTAWNEIYFQRSHMIISLWYVSPETFPLDMSIEKDDEDTMEVHLSLNDAEVIDVPHEVAQQRLRLLLDCAKTLYEVCQPCTGEMFWDGVSLPFVTFGKPLEPQKPTNTQQQRTLLQQDLPDGKYIRILDPIPMRRRGTWDWISLVDPETRSDPMAKYKDVSH